MSVRSRLHNVSKPGGESGGAEWTAGNETERRNRPWVKRLAPEVARHQPLRNRPGSEFESLPPSHFTRYAHSWLLGRERASRRDSQRSSRAGPNPCSPVASTAGLRRRSRSPRTASRSACGRFARSWLLGRERASRRDSQRSSRAGPNPCSPIASTIGLRRRSRSERLPVRPHRSWLLGRERASRRDSPRLVASGTESLPPSQLSRSTLCTYALYPFGVSTRSPTDRSIGRFSSSLIVASRAAGVRCEYRCVIARL